MLQLEPGFSPCDAASGGVLRNPRRGRRALGPPGRGGMRPLFLLVLALGLGCNGPTLVFPGGALSGESAPAPDDWSFAGDSGAIQLETDPAEPYSVNLAYTVLDGRLYLNAGDTETRWVRNMDADPAVRVKIDGRLYDLAAARVSDPDEIDAFARAWTSQSIFRRDPSQLDEVWIYRLERRDR